MNRLRQLFGYPTRIPTDDLPPVNLFDDPPTSCRPAPCSVTARLARREQGIAGVKDPLPTRYKKMTHSIQDVVDTLAFVRIGLDFDRDLSTLAPKLYTMYDMLAMTMEPDTMWMLVDAGLATITARLLVRYAKRGRAKAISGEVTMLERALTVLRDLHHHVRRIVQCSFSWP